MPRVPLSVPIVIVSGLMMLASAAHAASPSGDTLSIQLMILSLCIVPVVYFLPSIFAATRDHPSANGIFTVNLLLGWTVVGWIIAFVWLLRDKRRAARTGNAIALKPQAASTPVSAMPQVMAPVMAVVDLAAQEIEDLAQQKLQHLISDDEYTQRRKAILDRWKANMAL